MNNINTDQYWDFRFQNNWKMMHGFEQTEFFAKVALHLMPEWLADEIREKKLTICDFGCAAGQAVDMLHRAFDTEVIGVDFSGKAVSLARETFPDYKFFQSDIVNDHMDGFRVDAGYLSNVLEHLDSPWEAAQKTAVYVNQYLIILIPFRETVEIEEHCSQFGTSNIPLEIGELDLIFANYMNCTDIPESLYNDCQIFLLYGRTACRKRAGCMTDLVDTFEQGYKDIEERNKQLSDQKENAERKSRQLEKLIAEVKNQRDLYRQEQKRVRNKTREILKCISIVQSGRVYRMGLAVQRFIIQCFNTHEKQDFFRWFLSRLIKKNTSAKALKEFDSLENTKECLRQILYGSGIDEVDETQFIRLKNTQRVVIFASVPYFDVGGGQRSAQLAKTFNAMGYQVFYIYGFPCTEDHEPELPIPVNEHEYIDHIHRAWFSDLADSRTIVIFEIPYYKFEPYLDIAKQAESITIYEHIDNWDSRLGCLFYDADVFQRFLKKADMITVTAKKLGEKIREYCSRRYWYLPNAVDLEIFEPFKQYKCPQDLKRGKTTLLYFGSLWGEWFEWNKIDYLADHCPDCQINLIGDYSGCKVHVRKKKKNVHFLGMKVQSELPAYLQYTDYALLPFKNSEIGAYVSPLKIFEYIAMNVRVLATALDDIKGYPNVYCSDSAEDWVKVISSNKKKLSDCTAFLNKNNWYARCMKIMELSGLDSIDAPSLSVIVLNYNNRKVIRRCVDTLIAHNRRYGYEIVVVDNGSTDGSYEFLQEHYQGRIVLVRNAKNGCSSGRNLGVRNSTGKYVCFLDSDQWIISDCWLDSVLEILQGSCQIGAAGWNAGWFEPGKVEGPIVERISNRAVDSAKIWYRLDAAYLATSGFVMERRLFDEIGGFDEFYDPTCFEDTDLSLKIREAGCELAYCPYMGVMHFPHQTTKSGSRQHTKQIKRNGEYFEKKWKERRPELLEYYYI